MLRFIQTSREMHGVKNDTEYARLHATKIAALRRRGMRYEVHESDVVPTAYVNENRWVIDCECGAGNAVDMEAGVAYCFGCGAIHRSIVLPEPTQLKAAEQLLLKRPDVVTRNWDPRKESVEDLQKENEERLDRQKPIAGEAVDGLDHS